MNIGNRTERIRITNVTRIDDGGGGGLGADLSFITVWANVRTPSAFLRLLGAGEHTEDKKVFNVRSGIDVREGAELYYDDGRYTIKEVIEDKRKAELEITAIRLGKE